MQEHAQLWVVHRLDDEVHIDSDDLVSAPQRPADLDEAVHPVQGLFHVEVVDRNAKDNQEITHGITR